MRKSNERGITLVALVVTIVVLLILAGITITYVLSPNGIIGQAQKATKDTGADHINSSYALALAATTVEWYDPGSEINKKKADGSDEYTLEQKVDKAKDYFVDRVKDYDITADKASIAFDTTSGLKLTAAGTCTYNSKTYTVTYNSTTGKFSAALPAATE